MVSHGGTVILNTVPPRGDDEAKAAGGLDNGTMALFMVRGDALALFRAGKEYDVDFTEVGE